MTREVREAKTCNRCGRSGSHAFRRTHDGLFECITTTACLTRARRQAGQQQGGRGRLARHSGLASGSPGVAYVIGSNGPEAQVVGETLRQLTDFAIVTGSPSKLTLAALGSRNVKLIAVAATCMESIGFRNEFLLRCRQPRLSGVPILVFGRGGAGRGRGGAHGALLPQMRAVSYRQVPSEMALAVRAAVTAIDAEAAGDEPLPAG